MMKQYLFIIAGMIFATSLWTQEICNNALDDDGNGLIDLHDPACYCAGITILEDVSSLIPNNGIETFGCCPSSFSELDCATGWENGSKTTPDYLNTCGFVLPGIMDAGLIPFPEGNGILGAVYGETWKEYVGTCLTSPLEEGGDYALSFFVAALPIEVNGTLCNDGNHTFEPVAITLYGNKSCQFQVQTTGCPSWAETEWVALGEIVYLPDTKWDTVTISFTAPFEVNGIMLGPPCHLPPGYAGIPCYAYMAYDHLRLYQHMHLTELSSEPVNLPCDEDYGLKATVIPDGGEWQWYFNGIAIPGEDGPEFLLNENNSQNGIYQVVYTLAGACISDSILVELPSDVTVSQEVYLCPNSSVSCAGQWFDSAGIYQVIIPLPTGCDSLVECMVIPHELSDVTFLKVDTCGPIEILICDQVFSTSGMYEITCVDERGCDSLVMLDLHVVAPEAAVAKPSFLGDGPHARVLLDGTGSTPGPFEGGMTHYQWLGPPDGLDGPANTAIAFAVREGEYCLVVQQEHNNMICTDTLCVTVRKKQIQEEPPVKTGDGKGHLSDTSYLQEIVAPYQNGYQPGVFIPNSFSPNGDGINDVFRLYGNKGMKKLLRLTIFDRHGNMVFQQAQNALHDTSPGWDGTFDGKPVDTGTYFFVAEIEMMDGIIRFHNGEINLVK